MNVYLVIASIGVGLLGLVSIIPALLCAAMMFDAPGSTENPATISLAIAVASFPFVCFFAIAAAWALFAAGMNRLAKIVIWAPIINLIAGAIALCCLEAFYGGKFNG